MAIVLWSVGAALTIAGLFKLKRLVQIIKEAREVYQVWQKAKLAESHQGVEISAEEWKKIADEAMDVVKLLISWGLVWYNSREK